MKRPGHAIKGSLDFIMLGVLAYLLHYRPGQGLRLHAWLGIVLFVLFLLHHLLNLAWYRSLRKGKWSRPRLLLALLNLLLSLALLALLASSIQIAGMAFPLSWQPMAFWRSLHVFSAAWMAVLAGLHMGYHLNGMLVRLERKAKNTVFGYAVYVPEVLLAGGGIWAFSASGLAGVLSGTRPALTPLSLPVWLLDYLLILLGAAVMVHGCLRLLMQKQPF